MPSTSSSPFRESYTLEIGSGQTGSSNGERTPVYNPSTAEVLTEVPAGTADDLDRAVTTASEAFEEWRLVTPKERSRLLLKVAERITEAEDRLARIETLENGRPLVDARGQVQRCARHFEYYAGIADKVQGTEIPLDEDHVNYTVKEPLGVTGHIVPWNVPIYLFARSVAPALAAGNTVVVKPPNLAPVGGLEVGYILNEVLPDGVVNIVTGSGSVVGDAMSKHPDVESITFTGSGSTGVKVGQNAASAISDVVLELGGKSPLVVYPDVDIDRAVTEVIRGIFTGAGQICSASSRALVHEEIHDRFVEQLVEQVKAFTIGPGIENPDMGPLISESHLEDVLEYIELGREEVGDPVTGGERIDRTGYFLRPTVFNNVPNESRIAQEEIFGPVLTVTTFSDEGEAIELANDVEYGLAAGVMTDDVGKAHRFAKEVKAGQIYVNEWFAGGNETPFGGFKQSGVGRDNGTQAIENFTQIKNVCVNISYR
ncbi:aldehyde dehydrogenase family protein [Natrialbaceae archaeon A-CW2]